MEWGFARFDLLKKKYKVKAYKHGFLRLFLNLNLYLS